MRVKIKKIDLQDWIKYNTWLKVITSDLELEVIEDKDSNFLIKTYENR